MKVVIDTNVWVSGLINRTGTPARVLDAYREHQFTVVLSEPLLHELAEVLRRPKIANKYGVTDEDVQTLEELLGRQAVMAPIHHTVHVCRDPDDDVVLEDQHLALQLDTLKRAGCERVFTDVGSGARFERPGLQEALAYARPGDVLVVWRLDRLGRSLDDLVHLVNTLREHSVGFRSLQEAMDTTTPGGTLVFHLFGALAEFERALIRERTQAGLRAARARGHLGGRPRKLTPRQVAMAQRLLTDPSTTVGHVAEVLQVSRSTLTRALKRAGRP